MLQCKLFRIIENEKKTQFHKQMSGNVGCFLTAIFERLARNYAKTNKIHNLYC